MLVDAKDRAVLDDEEGDLLIDAQQIHDEKT
jgi:hypothetical protein